MTRIGFAYNLKPDADAPSSPMPSETARPDEEPPSTRRDNGSRSSAPPSSLGDAGAPTPSGGPDIDDEFAEWDSEATISAVARALSGLGEVIRLEANEEFPERLRAARPDIVFNIAEGLGGVNREAHVPAILEFYGVPYSGSDPFTLSLCLDKARTKEVLSWHGVPNAAFVVVRDEADLGALLEGTRDLGLGTRNAVSLVPSPESPVFVKPLHEGSSKGITNANLCHTREELEHQTRHILERYAQPALVEAYLAGDEFTCAVMGNGDGAHVLPLVGMNFASLPDGAAPIYSYEAKWVWDRPENPLEIFECPAKVDDALRARIEDVVLRAYRVLGCRDWSRIDVRLDAAGVPNVVEVNPLPGILPDPEDNSCFPKAARAAGMGYDALIQACLRYAAERQGVTLPLRAARPESPRRDSAAAALG